MYNLSKKKLHRERKGREKEKSEEYLSCWLPLVKFINNIIFKAIKRRKLDAISLRATRGLAFEYNVQIIIHNIGILVHFFS